MVINYVREQINLGLIKIDKIAGRDEEQRRLIDEEVARRNISCQQEKRASGTTCCRVEDGPTLDKIILPTIYLYIFYN